MITLKKLKILFPLLIMLVISLLSIYSAKVYTNSDLGNIVLKQFVWYLIGFIFIFFIFKIKNNYIFRHSRLLYYIGVISLAILLIFGTPINGSKCWIVIPGIGSIQPSEFMKLFIILYLATVINNFRNKYKNPTMLEEFKFLVNSFFIVLIPSVLTFLQPDTGAVLIYLIIYICMIFFSGIRLRWFVIGLLLIVITGSSLLLLYRFNEHLFISIFGSNIYYRINRVFSWQEGNSLQLNNAIIAIGSGGLYGNGFNSVPLYFPESSTDFIFAVYASCFGLIGVIILLITIIYFDYCIISLIRKRIVNINKYVLGGIIGMILYQQIQNIGMNVGLLPITGITLPFISYGGSSLISYMVIIGIILNIYFEKERYYKY